MTKKRIGTIYGSPIIEGDKNLKTSNEIHVSELGGGGEENNLDDTIFYYKHDLSENISNFVNEQCDYFPVISILIYSTNLIAPVTPRYWATVTNQDSRSMRGFCISGKETTMLLPGENTYELLKMSGSLEDRCKIIGTSMEETFPTVTRISKEEWESYINY